MQRWRTVASAAEVFVYETRYRGENTMQTGGPSREKEMVSDLGVSTRAFQQERFRGTHEVHRTTHPTSASAELLHSRGTQ